jgi:TRAP-type C4-dicarboxylate transport system permease small subunit
MRALARKLRGAVETVIVVLLLAMVALTFVDVIGRRIVGSPVYGAHDITEHLMALVVFAGLPLVTLAGAHLTIDILDRLVASPRMAWWRGVAVLLVAGVLALIAGLFLRHGLNAAAISEVSQALGIPRAPLYLFMAGGAALAALAAVVAGLRGPVAGCAFNHKDDLS